MVKAGLFLVAVAGALVLALMLATHAHWIQFGPCGPDLLGYLLLGGGFLGATFGVLLILAGMVVSGIRKAKDRLAI